MFAESFIVLTTFGNGIVTEISSITTDPFCLVEGKTRELMECANTITEIRPIRGASLLPPQAPPPLTPLDAPDVELP